MLADERVKHVHAIAHGLQNASGSREFVGAITDITAQKLAEEKIREQETELRQMLDFAPQLIAVYGPNRERLHANRVALDYNGAHLIELAMGLKGMREGVKGLNSPAPAEGAELPDLPGMGERVGEFAGRVKNGLLNGNLGDMLAHRALGPIGGRSRSMRPAAVESLARLATPDPSPVMVFGF